jgi:hypothetical protein
MSFSSEEDDLYSASLQILESRKASSKKVHCYACDEEMRDGPLLICAECLIEECDLFVKNSSEDKKKD